MTGKEMMIQQLIKLLGIDKTLAEQLSWAVEVVGGINARLSRIETALGIQPGQPAPQTIDQGTLTAPHGSGANGKGIGE